MLWLDLGLGSLLLWGAVTGYHAGWRKSACGLGGLSCAIFTSAVFIPELRNFGDSYYSVKAVIETAVCSRLALPVSGGVSGNMFQTALPRFLWEALIRREHPALVSSGQLPVDLLVGMLGGIAAFSAALGLLWGFFTLLGSAPAGEDRLGLKKAARWSGALIGLIRQGCFATLLVGTAAPLAWLCGIPPSLLELERSLLARWAWQLFIALGIWSRALF